MVKRVIVDVDAGIDDILAILLLLHAEHSLTIKIEAITCVKGNTSVKNVYKNVERILKITGNEHVPVYLGSNEPLVPFEQVCEPYHFGKDGFGDLQYEDDGITVINGKPNTCLSMKMGNVVTSNKYEENAIVAINRIAMDNPGEISLICLAPLTNIALAMKINPFLSRNLKEILIMGGNYEDSKCTTPSAEFNFISDAEAAFLVLRNVHCPITILPKEPCEATRIPCAWRFDILGKLSDESIDLLNEAEKQYFVNQSYWITYDTFLVAAFLSPQVIEEQKNECVSIDLTPGKTRAEMLIHDLENNEPNCSIITKLNEDLFKRFLLAVFSGNK